MSRLDRSSTNASALANEDDLSDFDLPSALPVVGSETILEMHAPSTKAVRAAAKESLRVLERSLLLKDSFHRSAAAGVADAGLGPRLRRMSSKRIGELGSVSTGFDDMSFSDALSASTTSTSRTALAAGGAAPMRRVTWGSPQVLAAEDSTARGSVFERTSRDEKSSNALKAVERTRGRGWSALASFISSGKHKNMISEAPNTAIVPDMGNVTTNNPMGNVTTEPAASLPYLNPTSTTLISEVASSAFEEPCAAHESMWKKRRELILTYARSSMSRNSSCGVVDTIAADAVKEEGGRVSSIPSSPTTSSRLISLPSQSLLFRTKKSRSAGWASLANNVKNGNVRRSIVSLSERVEVELPDSARTFGTGLDKLLGGGVSAIIERSKAMVERPRTERSVDSAAAVTAVGGEIPFVSDSTDGEISASLSRTPVPRKGGLTDAGLAAERARGAERVEHDRRAPLRRVERTSDRALVVTPAWLGSTKAWTLSLLANASPARVADLNLNPFLGVSVLRGEDAYVKAAHVAVEECTSTQLARSSLLIVSVEAALAATDQRSPTSMSSLRTLGLENSWWDETLRMRATERERSACQEVSLGSALAASADAAHDANALVIAAEERPMTPLPSPQTHQRHSFGSFFSGRGKSLKRPPEPLQHIPLEFDRIKGDLILTAARSIIANKANARALSAELRTVDEPAVAVAVGTNVNKWRVSRVIKTLSPLSRMKKASFTSTYKDIVFLKDAVLPVSQNSPIPIIMPPMSQSTAMLNPPDLTLRRPPGIDYTSLSQKQSPIATAEQGMKQNLNAASNVPSRIFSAEWISGLSASRSVPPANAGKTAETATSAIASMNDFMSCVRQRILEVNAENVNRALGVAQRASIAVVSGTAATDSIAIELPPARYTTPNAQVSKTTLALPGSFIERPLRVARNSPALLTVRESLANILVRRKEALEADLACASELASEILKSETLS